MTIDLLGGKALRLRYVVLDFNGTLAFEGVVAESTVERLSELSRLFEVTIATADTFGTARAFASRVGVALEIVRQGRDKERLVRRLEGGVVAIGNGANDVAMFSAADLAIAVMGGEGVAVRAGAAADILAPSIDWALELLLHPKRLVATLRE